MEIMEMKRKKGQLELLIADLLTKFEDETKLSIFGIDMNCIDTSTCDKSSHFINVKIRVEL